MKHDVTIVIVNYCTHTMTIACLDSLFQDSDNTLSDISIIVVDNASTDDSVEKISSWIDENNSLDVHLICSDYNGGFSSGNNLGVAARKSKYYLLLNSDTIIRNGSVQRLLDTAKSTSNNVGLLTPRLEWQDSSPQESCFRFHTPVSEFINSAQTGFITRIFNKFNVPIPINEAASSPDWSSFACILIKKEVFDDIGLMDDGYFMYFEDAEFCLRARKAGWLVLNEPTSHVVHLRGGSSPVKSNMKLKKRLPRYYYESRTRYFYQTYGWFGLTAANLLWNTGRLISKTRQILGRHDKAVSEKQWRDIWINWLNPLKPYVHPDNYK